MILHLSKFQDGIPEELHGTTSAANLGLEEADAEPVGDLRYDLEAGISDGGLWLRGTLALDVRLTCVRTLEKFVTTLEVPDFAHQIEWNGREQIDLTEYLREDILLALPPYPKRDPVEETTSSSEIPLIERAPEKDTGSSQNKAWDALDRLKPKRS